MACNYLKYIDSYTGLSYCKNVCISDYNIIVNNQNRLKVIDTASSNDTAYVVPDYDVVKFLNNETFMTSNLNRLYIWDLENMTDTIIRFNNLIYGHYILDIIPFNHGSKCFIIDDSLHHMYMANLDTATLIHITKPCNSVCIDDDNKIYGLSNVYSRIIDFYDVNNNEYLFNLNPRHQSHECASIAFLDSYHIVSSYFNDLVYLWDIRKNNTYIKSIKCRSGVNKLYSVNNGHNFFISYLKTPNIIDYYDINIANPKTINVNVSNHKPLAISHSYCGFIDNNNIITYELNNLSLVNMIKESCSNFFN